MLARATLFETAFKDAAKFDSEPHAAGDQYVKFVKTKGQAAPSRKPAAGRGKPTNGKCSKDGNCYRCDKPGHSPADCYFKRTECRYCKKVGHIERACRKKRSRVNHLETDDSHGETEPITVPVSLYDVNGVACSKVSLYTFDVDVNGVLVTMEVDTGSLVSILNKIIFTHE